jgi:hypothetical protein
VSSFFLSVSVHVPFTCPNSCNWYGSYDDAGIWDRLLAAVGRSQLKCYGTRAETRSDHLTKLKSQFQTHTTRPLLWIQNLTFHKNKTQIKWSHHHICRQRKLPSHSTHTAVQHKNTNLQRQELPNFHNQPHTKLPEPNQENHEPQHHPHPIRPEMDTNQPQPISTHHKGPHKTPQDRPTHPPRRKLAQCPSLQTS